MDDKNNKVFNCDVLICGTSLLNSLLSVYFSLKGYKVINIDKNNYYGDVNCSLSFNQFQDEKNNLHNFYEEYFPFYKINNSHEGSEKEKGKTQKEKLDEIIKSYFQINNNKFNIDINPKILYNESDIVNLLLNLNAHTYIGFVGMQHFYLSHTNDEHKENVLNTNDNKNQHSGDQTNNENQSDLIILKIPLNKSQVFLDPNLTLIEKRMIMNFIYKHIIHDKNYTFSRFSNYNFIKTENTLHDSQSSINNSYGNNNPDDTNKNCVNNETLKREINEKEAGNSNMDDKTKEHDENINILDYLKAYKITDKLTDYIIYGIGLFEFEIEKTNEKNISEYYLNGFTKEKKFIMNKREFMQRLHILINSLNKFKLQNLFENAFIYPSYGLNDIIFSMSRVSCLNNAIYMINRNIKNINYSKFYTQNNPIEINNKYNDNSLPTLLQINEVILDNGYVIKPKFVISSGSNINFHEIKKFLFSSHKKKINSNSNKYDNINNCSNNKIRTQMVTSRLIVLSTYSFLGKDGVSFFIHKDKNNKYKKQTNSHNIHTNVHILQLDYSSGSCPPGFFLTYFTYLEIIEEHKITNNKSIDLFNNNKNQTNDKKNDAHTDNHKPLNYLLLFDVLKLFIKKSKGTSNSYVDQYLSAKNAYNDGDYGIVKKISDYFSNDFVNNNHCAHEFTKLESAKNEEKKETMNCTSPYQQDGVNNIYDSYSQNSKTVENTENQQNENKQNENEQNKSNEFFLNSFNDLLKTEGIIYCAYYEYKPIIYRKDTIKLINNNIELYKKIFENVEKSITNAHNNIEFLEKRQSTLNYSSEDEKKNVHADNENNDLNINNKENMKQNISCNDLNKKNDYQLDENTKICNLLFTNDIHNYPIYPLIEDVSTFFYIINKFNDNFNQPDYYQTTYDTFANMIETYFNNKINKV
ncbi:GDP dissociation inhibitor, putative [Plasmodium vinckei vinckei]|uniref:GDP dissociation inhibitor, putative n=1 Tax=Plasmodium vinckei vinckei TaxID=54757 RepID=A0A449BPN0_PLAVN|nr:GDP dissociation inhibitor, putative [Plasmodium vinckei vinckei]VEV55329.1 GDP dissociation inhibitor, putative [Plasmodium vinckei vinckei]